MESELCNQIDFLLWKDWDPIGVNDFGEDARSEYSVYAFQIEDLLIKDVEEKALAQYLFDVETKRMGLRGNQAKCEVIAARLLKLPR
jgi:hypothetical protein